MNKDVWTVEGAKQWAECMSMAKQRWKATRLARRVNGVTAVYFPLLAIVQWFHVPHGRPWLAIANMVITWVMYRLYLVNRRNEKLWREIIYHQTRMCVETKEQGLWHSQQMDLVLNKLSKKTFGLTNA